MDKLTIPDTRLLRNILFVTPCDGIGITASRLLQRLCAILALSLAGMGALAQQPAVKQDPEALSILRDVVAQDSSTSNPNEQAFTLSGAITIWHRAQLDAPFTLRVQGNKQHFFAALPDGSITYHSREHSALRTAQDGSKSYATRTRHRLWLYPNSGIEELMNDPDMNIILVSRGKASGDNVAIISIKDKFYQALTSRSGARDKFAIDFEINIDKHEVMAVTDCSVPTNAIPTKDCVMHRMEYSDYHTSQNIHVPHTVTEFVGLMPVNVFIVNTVTFGQ